MWGRFYPATHLGRNSGDMGAEAAREAGYPCRPARRRRAAGLHGDVAGQHRRYRQSGSALVLPAALLMLAAVPAETADADVKELFAIDLADYPGKEGRMIEVSYPPGARDIVHRHDAHAFVYVLEGQIVMQLKGKPAVTLTAGQTFLPAITRARKRLPRSTRRAHFPTC
jgi:hypothetical protein